MLNYCLIFQRKKVICVNYLHTYYVVIEYVHETDNPCICANYTYMNCRKREKNGTKQHL